MGIRNFFAGKAVGTIAVLAVVGVIFACQSMSRMRGEAVQPPASKMMLGMKPWVLVSASSVNGRELRPGAGKEFSVTFGTDGKFSARTDCNSMGGSYAAGILGGASPSSTSKISFSGIFMTEMYCEGSQETEFAALLEQAEKYHFTAQGQLILDLKSNGGSAVFR